MWCLGLGPTGKGTKSDWNIGFPLEGINSQMGYITFHIRFEFSWLKWWTIHSALPVVYPTVNQKYCHRVRGVKPIEISEGSDMWDANCSPPMSAVFIWLILNGCISVLIHVEPV